MHTNIYTPSSFTTDDIAHIKQISEGCARSVFGINEQTAIDVYRSEKDEAVVVFIDMMKKEGADEFAPCLHQRLVDEYGDRYDVNVKTFREHDRRFEHRARARAA